MLRKNHEPLGTMDLIDLEAQFNKLVDENKTKEPISIPLDTFGALIQFNQSQGYMDDCDKERDEVVDELNDMEKSRDRAVKALEAVDYQICDTEDCLKPELTLRIKNAVNILAGVSCDLELGLACRENKYA
ncbi:hypothetical protein KAR91_29405 [Candidatus Pacearchaeota archaeon]|nr:hypothetical protein [Candidatus Pacearchaeota archaeon]